EVSRGGLRFPTTAKQTGAANKTFNRSLRDQIEHLPPATRVGNTPTICDPLGLKGGVEG
ncbi:hypothetical protein A2U01_0084466, partial [Trifolium medium]|nr:hypothetical protein [Trifolium medium]